MIQYIILAIAGILLLLVFLGKKNVRHEIFIKASPDKVWQVLTNTDSYDKWNPVMRLLEGKIEEGNKVKYNFTQEEGNAYDINSNVKKIIPNKLLNQRGGIPFVLTFDHKYILEQDSLGTKLIINEDYSGIGVNFWNPKPVKFAYKRLNEAIKVRVESLY